MIANKVLDYNTGKRITCVLLGKQTGYTDDRIGRWLKQQQNMNITSQRDGVDAAVQLWLNNQKNRTKLTKNPALVDLGSPGERMSAGKTHSCSFTVVLLGQGCNTTGASARHPFTPGVMTREFISVAVGRHKSTLPRRGHAPRPIPPRTQQGWWRNCISIWKLTHLCPHHSTSTTRGPRRTTCGGKHSMTPSVAARM